MLQSQHANIASLSENAARGKSSVICFSKNKKRKKKRKIIILV